MPIHVNWIEKNPHIAHVIFELPWTLDEYEQCVLEMRQVGETEQTQVYTIFDLNKNKTFLPDNMLSNIRQRKHLFNSPNYVILTLIISPNTLIRQFFTIASRLSYVTESDVVFVQDLDEALAKIEQHKANRQNT